MTIATNGTVTWQATEDRHEIVFVGTAPPAGNVGVIEQGSSAARSFPNAGTYDYECLRHRDKGMRGKVIVGSSASTPTPSPSATVTTPSATFSPQNVLLSAGGTVTWQFSEATHNVTFQGATPPGGSVGDQSPGTSASRTFPTSGSFDYVCTRHSGMTGRVTVQ